MKKHIIRLLVVMLSVCLGMAVISACTKPKTYTVTYLAGGGTGTAPTVEKYKEGEEFTVKENTFTYEGYTFTTWNDGAKNVAPGAKYVMPAKDITFTAQWKKEIVDNYSGYWTGEAEGAKLGDTYAGKTFEVEAAVMLDETDLFVAFMFTEKGGTAKLGAGVHGTVSEEGAIDFNGTAGKLENDKLTIPFGEKASIEFSGRKALGDAAEPDGVYSSGEEGEEKFLDFNRGAIKLDAAFVDAEFLSIGKYIVGYQEMGEVSLSPFAAVMDGDNIVYYDMAGDTYTFTPYDGEITEAYAYTSATLEATAEKVYVVVSGTFSGYTKNSFEAALKDSNENVLAPSVCLGEKPWTYQETTTEVEVNRDGTWTVKIDVTALDGTIPFFVCMNRSGSGDIKTLPEDVNVSEELGEKKYTIQKGHSSTLTLTVGKAGQKYAFTGMTLETAADKIYLVVSGTYSGYTDQEIKAAFEDEDLKNLALGINNSSNWQWPDCPTTVTAENGQFSVKLDITEVELGTFTICENRSGVGDIKWNEEFAGTVTFGDKKYTIERQWAGGSEVKIEAYVEIPEDATYEVTAFTLEKQGDKVYLLYKGTCANYDAETLETALKALPLRMDIHKINGTATGADGTGWTFSMGEGTWEMKIDITAGESDYFTPGSIFFIDGLNNYSDGGKYYNLWNQQLTIELGTNLYKAGAPIGEKQGDPIYTWGNVTFSIESTIVPTYTFSAPTSAKLELMNDKGNGTDENFENEIGRAFFVLSGTYTGEVTEAIAKDYFKFASYPFEFGTYNSTKDRTRRISIDATAKTYTLKIDVSWLPAGEHYCRFNAKGGPGNDLLLDLTACPASTVVKSVGSTYTLTNYHGQEGAEGHWGCIVLKVERNYAVTEIKLEDSEGTPTLVVNGTFESDKFSAAEIKKFLEDEDVRSMCVDLNKDGWKKMATSVTTEEGTFTVKMDLSSLEIADGYLVCTDCSGYGDIKTEYTGTITAGGKIYTFGKDSYGNLTINVTEAPKLVEKTFTVKGIALEGSDDYSKAYVVLTADVAGYTEDELKTLAYVDGAKSITAESAKIAEGVATIKFNFTDAEVGWWWGHYKFPDANAVNLKVQPAKQEAVYANGKQFVLFWHNKNGMPAVEVITTDFAVMNAKFVQEGEKLYLVLEAYNGANYSEEQLKTFTYIGEIDTMTVTAESVTVEGKIATLKLNVSDLTNNGKWWWGHYTINGGAKVDLKGGFTAQELTFNGKKYSLFSNDSAQIIFNVENA